jgi:hypothetical protein
MKLSTNAINTSFSLDADKSQAGERIAIEIQVVDDVYDDEEEEK